MVKAYSGNYQVFASGMFFSFSGHDDFRLEFAAQNGFSFNMYIKNFGIGAGTSKTIEIATVSGKKMYIHFWLEAIDSSQQVHSLKYTTYTEE